MTVRDGDLVALGGDLQPATLLNAYRAGLFPMRLLGRRGPLGWWSPDPRGVLPVHGFHVSRVRCGAPAGASRSGSTPRSTTVIGGVRDHPPAGRLDRSRHPQRVCAAARARLPRTASRRGATDALVGGLYGVSIGGLFAGESMFHTETDASKAALAALVELLDDAHAAARLIDVQWQTAAPGLAGRRGHPARGVPGTARRRRSRFPSRPASDRSLG